MRTLTGGAALEAAILEEMTKDSKVCYMGEDVGKFGGAVTKVSKLYETFGGSRVMDMPLNEDGFTGLAIGMAWQGQRPIVEYMYPDFIPLAMHYVTHAMAKNYFLSNQQSTCPMVIRSAQGIGSQCGAHHSECVEGWFQNYPGIKIAVPTAPKDIYGMMKYAIRDNDPCIWLESRTSIYTETGEIPEADEDYILPFGKANVVREGTDVTIIAWHKLLRDAEAAAKDLEAQGISCEIIDPRTLRPFDLETCLKSVAKTGRVIVAAEANKTGGYVGQIAADIAENGFEYLKAPIIRIGTPDTYIPIGTIEWEIVPDKMDVIRAVKGLLGKEILDSEKGRVMVDVEAELRKTRPEGDES